MDTSVKLMDYYYKNDRSKFEDNAPKLYAKFRYTGKYLIEKIKSGTSFYISVLKDITIQKGKLKYYLKLKEFLNEDELTGFVDSIESHDFKALLLAEEKRFDELILFIEKHCIKNSSYFSCFDFNKAIKLISTTHPDKSGELINKKIKQMMQGERNRDTYHSIAKLLKKASTLNGKNNETSMLINELYNHKPNLPALKDEFRKAGII